MALVRVLYTAELSVDAWEKALTCRRCKGGGVGILATEPVCKNCEGDGFSRDNGWTYVVPDDWDLEVGDQIVVPPTPRSETEQTVVVIGIGSIFAQASKLKSAIRRV